MMLKRQGKRMFSLLVCFAIAGITAIAGFDPGSKAYAANLTVANAGFESPNVGTGSYGAYQYSPTGGNWTFYSAAIGSDGAGVAGNGSGFTSNNPNAPEGSQAAFLQKSGSISQTVSGFGSGTSVVTFSAAQRNGAGGQTIQVTIDGTAAGTVTPSGTSYQDYSVTLTASAGSHVLGFSGTNTSGDHTAFIDNVRVVSDGSGGGGAANPGVTQRYMGINIEHPSDSSNLKHFANAYRVARWGTATSPGNGTMNVDSSGNPTGDFGLLMWDGNYINDTEGTYAISFNGSATVTASGATVSVSYNTGNNTSSGTMVVSSNTTVSLTFTNTKRTSSSPANSGITNVKIMRPVARWSSTSYSPTITFTNQFKDIITNQFHAKAIRFMDFTATNGKTAEVNWSDRVTPAMPQMSGLGASGYGWQGKGGAWEYVIRLCNELNTDCWIDIPVSASNDYINKLAQLFKYGSDGVNPYTSPQSNPVYPPLNASLKLYLEYSNELWNSAGGFTQTTYNRQQAINEVSLGGSPLNYDGETDSWRWAWRRQGKRTVEISNAFRSVFGNSEMMSRVRPVLLWQQGNGQATAHTLLTFLDNYYNNADGYHVSSPHPVNYYIWGGSGSAYYYPNNDSDSLTVNNIWTSDTFSTTNWASLEAADASWAAAFGLERTAYEGGPSMDNRGHSESVKEQAWNDSRMKQLVIDHHNVWEQYGGDVLMYFVFAGSNHSGYYQWEWVKDMANPSATSPKLQAVNTLSGGTKMNVTFGTSVGTAVDGNRWDTNNRGWGTPGNGSITMNAGSSNVRFASYNFKSTSTASRTATITYSSNNAASVEVYIDGVYAGMLSTSGTGGSAATFTSSAISTEPGLHAVRLNAKAGPITINTVKLN